MTTGWREALLGDVCEIVSGATPKSTIDSYWGGEIPWLTPADLGGRSEVEISTTQRTLTAEGLASCSASLLPISSVLLSSRAPIGHLAINTVPMATNQGFKSLIPSDAVDARYLYRWREYRRPMLQDLGTGATFKEISKRVTASVVLPLPPIEEQRRIAAILDAADTLRTKRRQALAKLDTLTQAIFIDMFGDPSNVEVGKLGDHVPTTSGGTPSRSRQDYFAGDIPWVKSGELASGFVAATEEHITAEAVANSSAKLMAPGTVLLAMYGATVGEVATLGIEAATNQAICCLSPTDDVTGSYLAGFLHSMKRSLVERAAGGAQPNISQTIIRSLDLPLASLPLQDEFARRVARAGIAMTAQTSSERCLDLLFGSLQQRAFRGEL